MNNVRTFDLEGLIARQECAWPMCDNPGRMAIGRCYDGKRIYHCYTHHCMVIGHKQTYEVIQDRDLELGRWDGEGGNCG